jgi:hypothetical protein
MLVTDLAYRDMETRANGLSARFAALVRRIFRRPVLAPGSAGDLSLADASARLRLVPESAPPAPVVPAPCPPVAPDFRWRRHPQLRRREHDTFPADTEDLERGARSAAVRGLFLARSGRLDEARAAFVLAAAEAAVDLTAIPGFWDLSRGGMLAAVHAYEDAGRFREASALNARLRLLHRPRSVAAVPAQVRRPRSASGGT